MKRETIISKVAAKLKKELDSSLEKKMKVEDVDVKILHRGLPGSRDFPPESPEYEIEGASLIIPDLSQEEAEKLPSEFKVTKSYFYEDDGFNLDLEITFQVKVTNKKILPNGKVEIEYKEEVLEE